MTNTIITIVQAGLLVLAGIIGLLTILYRQPTHYCQDCESWVHHTDGEPTHHNFNGQQCLLTLPTCLWCGTQYDPAQPGSTRAFCSFQCEDYDRLAMQEEDSRLEAMDDAWRAQVHCPNCELEITHFGFPTEHRGYHTFCNWTCWCEYRDAHLRLQTCSGCGDTVTDDLWSASHNCCNMCAMIMASIDWSIGMQHCDTCGWMLTMSEIMDKRGRSQFMMPYNCGNCLRSVASDRGDTDGDINFQLAMDEYNSHALPETHGGLVDEIFEDALTQMRSGISPTLKMDAAVDAAVTGLEPTLGGDRA
jgi:hypothetical protein